MKDRRARGSRPPPRPAAGGGLAT
eukprot:SAG31_NODE_40478_length_280_cov_1.143646_1_plen_23_part_10